MARPSVGVVVATFGDLDEWGPLADRAIASVKSQTVQPQWTHIHGPTLSEARNAGARQLHVDWLIFLDADDELDKHYVEEMCRSPLGDIKRPSTLGIQGGVEDMAPVLLANTDLTRANYIVIGAMCRKDLFTSVGGFRDFPILEDWDLWMRMVRAGASITDVPRAIYRVHVNPGSRNMDTKLHGKLYRQIRSQMG